MSTEFSAKFLQLLDQVRTITPGQRVYFIYTHDNLRRRFRNGLKANTEISYWCMKALHEAFPRVSFLRLAHEKEWKIRSIGPKDVVIGHMGETYDRASKRTKRMIAFWPWSGHEDRAQEGEFNCTPTAVERSAFSKAQSAVLLTSEHNKKLYLDQRHNDWHDFFADKRVRCVHQPMDLQLFQRIKHSYHQPDFLYIGNDAFMKCLDDSRQLANAIGRKLNIYGVGERKLNHLDQAAVQGLVGQADFFLQPGLWEAQCVSILEAAARGFIPLVSPETGYPYEHPYLLKPRDFDYNKRVLEKATQMSAEEKKELADHLDQQLRNDPTHKDWSALTDALVEEVQRLL